MAHTIGFVPCKAHSRRVERKNSQFVGGLPLWLRKAQQLARLDCVDEVWVDTDSDEIALEAQLRGFQVMRRSDEVNEFDGHQLFAWEVREVERIRGLCSQPLADVYVQALCTAPFLSDASIERAVDCVVRGTPSALIADDRYDYPVLFYNDRIPDSDKLPKVTVDCMSLYVMNGDHARECGKRCVDECSMVVVDGVETLDIDYSWDLRHAQAYALGVNEIEMRWLRGLKPLLSSALLSDTMREFGYECELGTRIIGKCPQKMFGRACTLHLVEADCWSDTPSDTTIYDALKHYDWCMPGNILCVRGSDEHAYFGELNAALALRAGAQGAVIDGMTRDAAAVAALGFTVLSRGHTPKDCRDVLVVGSIATTIDLFGVEVHHGDLIFADADGAVRIPREKEDVLIEAALERLESECGIKLGIACGASTDDILTQNGNF